MVPALIICAILQGLQLSAFNDDPTEMCCYISLYAQIALFLVYVIYLGILIVLFLLLIFVSFEKTSIFFFKKK